jgi:WhiB family redox-sensing transcriptional regulator
MDSSVFSHPDGERGQRREKRTARAKAICMQCPVLQPCRAHALTAGEPYGVGDGLSENERRVLICNRRAELAS